jgi:hypothetical protein
MELLLACESILHLQLMEIDRKYAELLELERHLQIPSVSLAKKSINH